jgi:hypothetical protein
MRNPPLARVEEVKMRNFARRSGLAAIAIAALLGLLVTAAPAGARVFEIHGHAVKKNGKKLRKNACQGDMKLNFDLIVKDGRLKSVKGFETLDLNYPNNTPPAPYGEPSGYCVPDKKGWKLWTTGTDSEGYTDTFDLGEGPLKPNDFYANRQLSIDGEPVLVDDVFGSVHIKKKNQKFHVTAEGQLFSALAEASLFHKGSSTGKVFWEASN